MPLSLQVPTRTLIQIRTHAQKYLISSASTRARRLHRVRVTRSSSRRSLSTHLSLVRSEASHFPTPPPLDSNPALTLRRPRCRRRGGAPAAVCDDPPRRVGARAPDRPSRPAPRGWRRGWGHRRRFPPRPNVRHARGAVPDDSRDPHPEHISPGAWRCRLLTRCASAACTRVIPSPFLQPAPPGCHCPPARDHRRGRGE